MEGSDGLSENGNEAGPSCSWKRKCNPELTSLSQDELIEDVMKREAATAIARFGKPAREI
jgi:hypothetical protein